MDRSIYLLKFDTLETLGHVALSGKRPLCIEKYNSGIVYGEYYSNPSRESVKIIHIDGNAIEHCLAELSGVRHIHSIVFNEHLKKYLVCTGDLDDESCMFAFAIDFNDHHKLLAGSQKYRIVQPACRLNKVYFGSDMPHSKNSLHELDLDTKKLTKICDVPGPVFYSLVKEKTFCHCGQLMK